MILYGASGHGKVIIDILEANNTPIDYIVDDNLVVKQLYPNGADVHEYDLGNGRDILKMRNV